MMNEKLPVQEEKVVAGELVEFYGDPGISSFEGKKIPLFLLLTYMLLPIWGIITWYYFWNGSIGLMDPGYWKELQVAANTTFPIENQNMMYEEK